jgi:hypothetical protein
MFQIVLPTRREWSRVCLILAVAALGCGGGGDGPRTYSVSGTVSYDGKPIEEGRIQFRNTGSDGRAYSAEIKNGNYQMMSEAGSMKVEIIASRVVPGKMQKSEDGEMVPVREMFIPAKYNSQTTLTTEVKPQSQNIPFDLKK